VWEFALEATQTAVVSLEIRVDGITIVAAAKPAARTECGTAKKATHPEPRGLSAPRSLT
jgi:hypothetical protein